MIYVILNFSPIFLKNSLLRSFPFFLLKNIRIYCLINYTNQSSKNVYEQSIKIQWFFRSFKITVTLTFPTVPTPLSHHIGLKKKIVIVTDNKSTHNQHEEVLRA